MAVHVPLSVEAQMKRVFDDVDQQYFGLHRVLCHRSYARYCLGIYYMTKDDISAVGAGKVFSEEVRAAITVL